MWKVYRGFVFSCQLVEVLPDWIMLWMNLLAWLAFFQVYALTKERDTLRREQSKKSDAAALLKEKDEIISQVMAEGARYCYSCECC